jgi:hypothetical protein
MCLRPDSIHPFSTGKSSSSGATKSGDLYTTPEFRFHELGKGRALLSGVEIQAAAIETL